MIPLLPAALGLLGKVSPKVWIAAGAAFAIFLGYQHYTGLIDENGTLRANQAILETGLAEQGRTVKALQRNAEQWKKSRRQYERRMRQMDEASTRAAREGRRLDELFGKHDLARIARARPDAVEDRINRGTARIGRMLGCATGDHDRCSAD